MVCTVGAEVDWQLFLKTPLLQRILLIYFSFKKKRTVYEGCRLVMCNLALFSEFDYLTKNSCPLNGSLPFFQGCS